MSRKTIVTISLILSLFASHAAAVKRYVPNQYPNIQAAINVCSDGDEVIVADGVYSGSNNRNWEIIGLNITVRSENGPQFTIIDCKGPYSPEYRNGILLDSGCIDGFTITNARGTVENRVFPLNITGDCVVKNCIIANNVGPFGAGIYCVGGNPTINSCTILGNSAQQNGGGIFCLRSDPHIVNCVISGNSAQDSGGGISCVESNPTISSCTISGNSTQQNGGGIFCSGGNPTISSCTISGNSTQQNGGGIFCSGGNPTISSCTISGNSAQYNGGGICCVGGNLTISSCVISGNSASEQDGGGICCIVSNPTISSCVIKNNTAQASYGGGICCFVSNPTISSCVMSGNSAQWGGGISFEESISPMVINCTIISNFANFGGGIYSFLDSNPVLINSIIRDNLASSGSQIHVSYDLDTHTHSAVTISHSNIQGGQEDIYASLYSTVTWGSGNIDADPLFVDATNGVYHILVDSPCRDVGDNTAIGGYFETDLAGNPRIVGNAVDMGAYETQFVLQKYSLTASVIGGYGTVEPSSGIYDYETEVTLTVIPETGYRVKAWDGADISTTSTTNTVVMDSDKVVTVECELLSYGLTAYVVNGHGSINPAGGNYDYGTVVSVTAIPNNGYRIKTWHGTDDDTLINNTNIVTIDSDKEVSVEFELAPVSLTILVPNGHGVVPGASGSYGVDSLVEITATPDPGYRVESWYDANDALLSSEETIEVLMDSNKTISVIFEKIPDTIMFSKCIIKAGKFRSTYWSTDSIEIKGISFDAAHADFAGGNIIYISIYNQEVGEIFSDEIDVSVGKYKNGKFSYKGYAGRIKSLKFDINKNTFSMTAKKISLTGLSSSVAIKIEVGDYLGIGVAYDGVAGGSGGELDIVNGKKPIPMQLLTGYEDSLRVDKCKFKRGTKFSTDSLVIQGAIAVEDTSVNIAHEDVVVTWGDYSVMLPWHNMFRIKGKEVFKYKKPKGSDSSVAAAIFDLEKCTFKIVIKKANIGSQDNPVDFNIQFADFNETIPVQL